MTSHKLPSAHLLNARTGHLDQDFSATLQRLQHRTTQTSPQKVEGRLPIFVHDNTIELLELFVIQSEQNPFAHVYPYNVLGLLHIIGAK
jgi:hypothetical protein